MAPSFACSLAVLLYLPCWAVLRAGLALTGPVASVCVSLWTPAELHLLLHPRAWASLVLQATLFPPPNCGAEAFDFRWFVG